MPCSSGGTRGTRRCPRGAERPRRPTRGFSGPLFGRDRPTGSRCCRLSWRGGRCLASRMRRPTTGSPVPWSPPSPTGATAGGTHCLCSPSSHRRGDAGDGRSPPSQAMGTRGCGRASYAGHPPGGTGPPNPERTPDPPTVWRGGGARAACSRGDGGGNEHGGGPTAPQPANR